MSIFKKLFSKPVYADNVPIQIPTNFQTVDGADSPLTSPTPYTGSISPLTLPESAISVDLAPTTDLRVSEDPTMASYTIVPAGSEVEFPCGSSSIGAIYIKADSSDGSLLFRFNTMK
jgi:hypothetical protein